MMADMIRPNRLVGTWLLTGLLQPRRLVYRLLVYGSRLGYGFLFVHGLLFVCGPRLVHGFLVYRFGFVRRSLMRSKLPARWFRTMPRAGSGPLGGPLFGRPLLSRPLLGGLRCRTSVDRLPGRRLRLRSRRLMVGLGRTRWTVRSRGAAGTRCLSRLLCQGFFPDAQQRAKCDQNAGQDQNTSVSQGNIPLATSRFSGGKKPVVILH